MATWGLHIRVAEGLLGKGYDLDKEKFLIGNIGPDCGVPNEDSTRFSPPAEITHWSDKGRRNIYPDRFYDSYLADKVGDRDRRSFYIGYYTHLIVDKEWQKIIARKLKKDKHYAPANKDRKFILTIKKDWYDLDHLYFRDHKDSLFYKVFQHVEDFPNYLHYYPRGAIAEQIRFITDFYLNPPNKLDRKYKYMTAGEMEDFVDRTVFYLEQVLEEKNLVYTPAYA